MSASGASAAPDARPHASHASWQEHHQYHHQADSGHHYQADSHAGQHSGAAGAGASHASPSASPSASASASTGHAARPTASATARPGSGSHTAPSAAPTGASHASSAPSSSPSAPATQAPAPAPAQPGSDANAVQQVLSLINQARAAQGLPAYTITAGLTRSAEAHNQQMAGGCGMSHQCPGEAELGDRETAQGIQWNAVGENIGEGGPVSSASQDIAAMAVSLTQDMLNETPPNDGHRKNILSSEFTHIGIAVYRDAHGTVWLTHDFSN
ncbi:CAP domain-containing protein [Saccharothrix sp. ST-888]|uniref:CAP domain-containing protein n=1 Tax=Saccharothrix sp. ST-888 TaxID=1427391 RepID=UPI0018CFCC1C|nr:CAP domain-containing protein [Saccharothrix sp. ST-888]